MNKSMSKTSKPVTPKSDSDANNTSRMNGVASSPESVPRPASVSVSGSGSPQLPIKAEKKSFLNKIKKKLSGNPNRKKWRNGESVSPDEEFGCDPEPVTPVVPMRPPSHSKQWAENNHSALRRTIAAPPTSYGLSEAHKAGNRRTISLSGHVNNEKSPNGKLSYVKCENENVPVENGQSTSGASKPNYAQPNGTPSGAKLKAATLPVMSGRIALPSSSLNSSTGQRLSLQSPVAAASTPEWVYQRRFEPVYQELTEPPRTWTLTKELFRLSKFGWYWGPLSRGEAEDKLMEQPDGAFLVRDSSDERYLLSLSFRSYGKTLHTRIEHLNGVFSFYALPDCEGYSSIVDLIENSVRDSKAGVFCYSRSRTPNGPSFPVRLTTPVSRFTQVRTLQYLCRFVIRQYTRLDHIQKLPLPNSIKGWLEESQF